ncbi:unnamed protein product [Blepharisma stoltei]|uniref:Uncharacterized protein n=1 Tax=Blepharisma stoltei TaxID=1481888 RepID=A0AAU9JBK4_9CILI|nr:unnamed protein product [Blepharisma stoltei]
MEVDEPQTHTNITVHQTDLMAPFNFDKFLYVKTCTINSTEYDNPPAQSSSEIWEPSSMQSENVSSPENLHQIQRKIESLIDFDYADHADRVLNHEKANQNNLAMNVDELAIKKIKKHKGNFKIKLKMRIIEFYDSHPDAKYVDVGKIYLGCPHAQ